MGKVMTLCVKEDEFRRQSEKKFTSKSTNNSLFGDLVASI